MSLLPYMEIRGVDPRDTYYIFDLCENCGRNQGRAAHGGNWLCGQCESELFPELAELADTWLDKAGNRVDVPGIQRARAARRPSAALEIEPNGCATCGVASAHHGHRWHPNADVHTYQEPTNAQRLERMIERRALLARAAEPEHEPAAARRDESESQ